jgi:peptidase E
MTVKPVYLLAGGRGNSPKKQLALLKAVFDGCGVAKPSVAYSGTASGDDHSFFTFISESFQGAGAGKVTHAIMAPDGADLKKARKILENADIIFVSGGDVEAGMDILQDKKQIEFFNDLYKNGKPFFGISAGALMLAKEWVRWPDPDDDDSAELFPCLGYAPILCDAHDEGAGWEELQAAVALEPAGVTGYGMASNSGIKVDADGTVTLLGGQVFRYVGRGGKVVRIDDLPAPAQG